MAKNTNTAKKATETAPTVKGNRAAVLTALYGFKAVNAKNAKTAEQVTAKCGVTPQPSGPNVQAGLVAVAVNEDGKKTFYLTASGLKTAKSL